MMKMNLPLFCLTASFFHGPVSADNDVAVMRSLASSFPDWKPSGIIDVGANEGMWSRTAREIYPNAKILMVEACPMHDVSLKKTVKEIKNAESHIAVLSERDGDIVEFYQSGNTGNSMFKENSEWYVNATATNRTTSTLDMLVAESLMKDDPPDYLKLDVQGAELIVLMGAKKKFSRMSLLFSLKPH